MSSLTQQGSVRQGDGNTVLPLAHWPGSPADRSDGEPPGHRLPIAVEAAAADLRDAGARLAVQPLFVTPLGFG